MYNGQVLSTQIATMVNVVEGMSQEMALDVMKQGKNVYLTGPAGSGKSYTQNQYIKYLISNNINVAITASTGLAATHINGITIHSWSCIGINKTMTDEAIRNLTSNKRVYDRITKTKVLIIDEISMLHASQLDLVDRICKVFKKNNLPFGGMQVILCGDLFQLPPSTLNNEAPQFVYNSKIWHEMDLHICYLQKQYRQNDIKFLNVLNAIRENKVDDSTIMVLQERMHKPTKSPITPLKLYSRNNDVDSINNYELEKIDGKEMGYLTTSVGDAKQVETLKKYCLAPEKLSLKKNAVVMFVKNSFEKKYVNGTQGKVVDFSAKDYPIVEISSGDRITVTPESWMYYENYSIKASITQIPLKLAWAITIHKSQGMTLDAIELDLSKAFEFGMGYVALSRVRNLDGINLLGLNEFALQVNPKITEFDILLKEKSQLEVENIKLMSDSEKEKRNQQFLSKLKGDKKHHKPLWDIPVCQ